MRVQEPLLQQRCSISEMVFKTHKMATQCTRTLRCADTRPADSITLVNGADNSLTSQQKLLLWGEGLSFTTLILQFHFHEFNQTVNLLSSYFCVSGDTHMTLFIACLFCLCMDA